MKYHSLNGEIWKDSEFKSFSILARLIFLYLFSSKDCPPSGMYKKELDEMAFELKITQEALLNPFKELDGKWIAYDSKRSVVWVKDKIKNTITADKFKDHRVKSISRDIEEFKNCYFIQEFFNTYPEFIDIALKLERLEKDKKVKDCVL